MMRATLNGLVLVSFTIVLFCSVRAGSTGSERQATGFSLLPVDEAAQDTEFLAFRRSLLDAIKRRDAAFIIDSSVPTLQKGFKLFLARPKSAFAGPLYESTEWSVLERLLSLGGSFTTTRGSARGQREFCAPYTYSAYPWPPPASLRGETEPWVILGPSVPVYQSRALDAPVVARLSHDLVKADGLYGPDGPAELFWASVEYAGGKTGYVLADQIRSPDDYHACFGKIDGKWVMTKFEKGPLPIP